jgi:hypothetical protein
MFIFSLTYGFIAEATSLLLQSSASHTLSFDLSPILLTFSSFSLDIKTFGIHV